MFTNSDMEYYRNHPMYEHFFKRVVLNLIGEEKQYYMSVQSGLLDLVVNNNTMLVIPNETMEDRAERLRDLPSPIITEAAEQIAFPYVADEIDLYNELSNENR